jgi:hypothetical protein
MSPSRSQRQADALFQQSIPTGRNHGEQSELQHQASTAGHKPATGFARHNAIGFARSRNEKTESSQS